jgi:hypothetical protein
MNHVGWQFRLAEEGYFFFLSAEVFSPGGLGCWSDFEKCQGFCDSLPGLLLLCWFVVAFQCLALEVGSVVSIWVAVVVLPCSSCRRLCMPGILAVRVCLLTRSVCIPIPHFVVEVWCSVGRLCS